MKMPDFKNLFKRKPKESSKALRTKFAPIDGITLAFLIIFVLVFFVLILWGLMTSLKSAKEYMVLKDYLGFPKKITFENYINTIKHFNVIASKVVWVGNTKLVRPVTVGFGELMYNTLIYAVGGAFVSTACPCIMAYVVAKFDKWHVSKVLYGVVIVTMAIPLVGNLPASLAVAQAFGVYDSLWGNLIQKFNFLGFYFLIFHGNYKMLAKDYSEAAYLDGASEWRVFFTIILPLVKNIFTTVMLIKFIEFWNDYTTARIYLPSHPTIAYGIYLLSVRTETMFSSMPSRLAGAMVLFFPMLIVFCIFQKKLLGNLSMGGVKE